MHTIFSFRTGKTYESLVVNEDGSLTREHGYHSARLAGRRGFEPKQHHITAAEAKARWGRHAAEIDQVIDEMKGIAAPSK